MDKNTTVVLSIIVAIILLLAIIAVASAYWSHIVGVTVPINQQVSTFDTNSTKIVLTKPNMLISPINIVVPQEQLLYVYIYPKKPIQIENVLLSTNGSSVLTYDSLLLQKAQSNSGLLYYAPVKGWHRLDIRNSTEAFFVSIIYHAPSSTQSNSSIVLPEIENVPFNWNIQTLDLTSFSYLVIIFVGVLLSRLFPIVLKPKPPGERQPGERQPGERQPGDKKLPFGGIELLWIPFSAVIALLIFTSFHDEVNPTADILTNVGLAFGFGFGFDKILTLGREG
jgi:hypothetical protein